MGKVTGISWADATWNPWRGCTKVSPACDDCYMFREQRRYGRDPDIVVRSARPTFQLPFKIAEPSRIFTCSWSDFFHADADPWRDDAWQVIRETPQHAYLVLTKRPGRIARHLPADWGSGYPNVWLGVSVESAEFLNRMDVLRDIPCRLRFISAEPLIGSLVEGVPREFSLDGFGWVIAGGESGSRATARPMHPQWARELRDACLAGAGDRPLFHMKQWGSWAPASFEPDAVWLTRDGHTLTNMQIDSNDFDDPMFLNGAVRMRYCGPTHDSGGKYLDDTDWCEVPPLPEPAQMALA